MFIAIQLLCSIFINRARRNDRRKFFFQSFRTGIGCTFCKIQITLVCIVLLRSFYIIADAPIVRIYKQKRIHILPNKLTILSAGLTKMHKQTFNVYVMFTMYLYCTHFYSLLTLISTQITKKVNRMQFYEMSKESITHTGIISKKKNVQNLKHI